ncbi:hypothetical protein KSF_024410 [Reticulibacter mediterranei]|uniref:Uncharacterized protein n=1 Tax=Reticulibacter mediterranei TaxID=2778369 RepID=A0A8J3N1A5_9CHLR|nr:hypothetical protein KSF_024410 [Reticulibacter mediterranei]
MMGYCLAKFLDFQDQLLTARIVRNHDLSDLRLMALSFEVPLPIAVPILFFVPLTLSFALPVVDSRMMHSVLVLL